MGIKEEAEKLFRVYYPDKYAIANWIRDNYGKEKDKEEWELPLIQMLGDNGRNLLSKEYYQKRVEYYQKMIEYYQKWIEDYQKMIEDCTGSFSTIEIEAFIPYFLSHPNIYWA